MGYMCIYIYTLFLIVNVNNKTCDSLCIHKERQININKHKKYVINKYLAMFCLGMVENKRLQSVFQIGTRSAFKAHPLCFTTPNETMQFPCEEKRP